MSYDAAAGLRRHLALVEAGANLPAWAEGRQASRAASLLRGVGGMTLLGGLAALLWLSWPTPEPRVPARSEAPLALEDDGRQAERPTAASLGPNAPGTSGTKLAPIVAPVERAEATRPDSTTQAFPPSLAAEADPPRPPLDPPDEATAKSRAARAPSRARPSRAEAALQPHPGRGTRADPGTQDRQPARSAAAPATPAASLGDRAGAGDVRGVAPEDGEEIRLLSRARKMLKVDPLRALRLVREGEARFGQGYLRQERRYVEIRALRALGRHLEADALTDWFVQDYPDSPYGSQLE